MPLLSACSLSIDPVTITPVEYPQPSDFQKLSIPIGASFANDALRSNNYYGQFSNYAVPYNLSDIDHSYALATAQPVFKNVEFVGTDTGIDNVEFRLTRLPQTVLVDNALTPDVTDELVAQWILLDKNRNKVTEFSFVGYARSPRSWGTNENPKQAKLRTNKALLQLFRSTIDSLIDNEQIFSQFEGN
jgi:hypothetical protein